MFKTRITEMLGIKYPIIQGGMMWLSGAELTAAVSNAGGLGLMISAMFPTKETFRAELKKVKSLTNKPFGVNINLFPTTRPIKTEDYIEVLIEEGVRIVETSGRSPEPHMKQFKEGGVKVMHKVPGVRFAQTAERLGCDAVTLVGFECGGHPGLDDVSSMVLIPAAVNAVKIPVIAAGGFADGRGLVAALALGAEAVLMGTRFMATKECPAHAKFKEWLLNARETDTMIVQRSIRNPERVIRNDVALKVLEMENKGATLEELLPFISGELGRKVVTEGNINAGCISCGQAVGLISSVPSVKEVIDSILAEANTIIQNRLQPLAKA